MTSQTAVSSMQNALDSMDRVARQLRERNRDDLFVIKGVLTWSWHAVRVLADLRLRPVRERFDAWMQDYLADSEPGAEAFWGEQPHLSLLELLDIFSHADLEILKPEFYQGWQDRTTRCHELRTQLGGILGGNLDLEQRKDLLLLLAVHNSLQHQPIAEATDVEKVWLALPALFDLIELLLDKSVASAATFVGVLNDCRENLSETAIDD